MTTDPTHTLSAITPEHAEAGGATPLETLCAELLDLDSEQLVDLIEEAVADEVTRALAARATATRQAAATAVLTAARNLCCGEHPSAHHAATDVHSRVMAIAERLADAARGA